MENINLYPEHLQKSTATHISVTKLGKDSFWLTIKNTENGDKGMKRISKEFYDDFVKESERNKTKYKEE